MYKIEDDDVFDLYVDGSYGNLFRSNELMCKFCGKKPVKYYYYFSGNCVFACERHEGYLHDEENERWKTYVEDLRSNPHHENRYSPKYI